MFFSCRRRKRSGHRPGHHEQVRATHSERRPCNGLGTTMKYLRRLRSGFSGNGMGTTAKYLKQLPRATAWPPRSSICVAPQASAWAPRLSTRDAQQRNGQRNFRRATSGAAGNGLCTSIKYLGRTTSGRHRQRPKPMPGITHVPLHHKRPAFALFSTCLLHR